VGLASIIQAVGMLLIAIGVAMVAPWAGVVTAGICLAAFGLAMERSRSA
jgi:hypothetical protein